MRGWKIIAPTVFIAFASMLYVFFGDNSESLSLPNKQESAPEPILEPAKEVRNITPEEMVQAPEVETALLERLPSIVPPPPPKRLKKPKPVTWKRPVVKSAGILIFGEIVIQLAEIDPIALEKKCIDQNGVLWPCGMLARTEFRQFIRGRPIECDPVDGEASTIKTRCRLSGYDMSAWLVLTGWAMPSSGKFSEELNEAKSKERGQWRPFAP